MYTVPVAILPILVIVLVVAVARYITTVAVIAVVVIVLIVLLIVRRPLFIVPGIVSLPAVRTTTVVLFATALTALLTRGMVFLIGR